MTTTSRIAHMVAGVTLAVAGVAGLAFTVHTPAAAAGSAGTHDAMQGDR